MSQYKVRKLHLRPMPRRQSLISSQSFVVVVNHEFWSQSHLKCRCHRSSRFFCPWDKLTKVFHDGSCKPKKHHLQLHNDFMVLLHELLLTACRKRISYKSKRTNTPNRSFPNMIKNLCWSFKNAKWAGKANPFDKIVDLSRPPTWCWENCSPASLSPNQQWPQGTKL